VSTLAVAERQSDVLSALRSLGGKATVGDVVAATGLAATESQATLKQLLETHQGQLAVSDSGELLYRFDEKLIRRGTEPLLARVKRRAWDLFSRAFKAWIVIMLVVYFVIFVILVLAALFANQQGGNRRSGGWGGRGRRGGGGLPIGNLWFWYWIWGPRWYLGRPYYGHRWERTLQKDDKVPFYKKVFAFVFGPDRPHPTQQQIDRSTLRLILARGGVITTAELVEHTGVPVEEAESEMGRLVGAYDGEPTVSPDGELAYGFPSVMLSAHGPVSAREPNPSWMRLEYPLELTGNTGGANVLVGGMNAFTLIAAATSPWFIFPRLHMGGPAAFVGLVVVPVIFSLMFFAVPGLRMWGVKRENRRRARRNVRRVTLGLVYARSLEAGGPNGVTVDEAYRHVASRLDGQTVSRAQVEKVLHALAAEFDADVAPDADGKLVFRFPEIRRQVAAGEVVRRSLSLEGRTLGDIVYDTGDTPSEADARDQASFDRALKEADLSGYVPSPERVGYEADYEVVLSDEEVRTGRLATA
jgi:hypothetical protein